MAPLAPALLAIALIAGCAMAGQTQSPVPSDEPSVVPSAGDMVLPSGGDGQTYDGQLLGVTIADLEALAVDLGLECTIDDEPLGHDAGYSCRTSTPEADTPEWFIVTGHMWDDEAYELEILTTTAPPDVRASRDAVADIAETLMPWIADLGWFRDGVFSCRDGRQGARQDDNFGQHYSMCARSSRDPVGDGTRSGATLDIATEP